MSGTQRFSQGHITLEQTDIEASALRGEKLIFCLSRYGAVTLRPCPVITHPWLHLHHAQEAQMQRASNAYCKNDSQGHVRTPWSICAKCMKKLVPNMQFA